MREIKKKSVGHTNNGVEKKIKKENHTRDGVEKKKSRQVSLG